ncbi:unnamed protein product [Acanthoscelides obtectus]|uniref:Uncharacterized protein n=1 Tax=Acanthoscelides obtectus TaxID=200917 RepID=A0A9P0NZB9_ACAOB|nr:unnamed protein product [Acanthoscelides obtectus]CAK1663942.1 hypothetical protein AOBTE_LOCUS23946 [Acanthoscelides obtectus]
MATLQQKLPESSSGRSPKTPARKILCTTITATTTDMSTWRSNTTMHPYINDNAKSLSEFNNNIFGVNTMVQGHNKNLQEPTRKSIMPTAAHKVEKHGLKQSLPKLLCLKKSPSSNYDELQTLNVNALREDYNSNKCTLDNSASSSQSGEQEGRKNRNSFHQNVEEALSSLLWQPYEYQNNSGKSLSLSSSSCSSRSSSSLADLDEITKSCSDILGAPTCDPHACAAATATEMVIHLPAADSQSASAAPTRDPPIAQRAPSRLSQPLSLAATARLCTSEHAAASCHVNGGDMQANGGTTTPLFASTLNLSSANVVGLPGNHSRYASVPVQTRPIAFPNHSRNVSEPASQFLKFGNNTAVVPAHRHSSHQVDQSNLHQINNQLRSSSVPNSAPPRQESGTTTSSTISVPNVLVSGVNRYNQKPQNVSNVNVNFYKAVPVNVASSVPTIHCLNTVQGNDVSNVQVLPLGTNFSSPQSTISAGSSGSPAHVSGTTQVILHNTPENLNRNTLLEPHFVPNSTSITNFLPPPPITTSSSNVIIQNARTMVSLVGTTSPARTYTNAGINTVQVSTSTAPPARPGRTFTSTEAQTDDISVLPPITVDTREHRRRERRERRHQRRIANGGVGTHRESSTQVNDRLPDLLNSHLPPPYTPAPPPQNVLGAMPPSMVPPPAMVPPPPGHPAGAAVLQTVVPNNIVPPSGFVYPPPPPVVPGQVPSMVQGAPSVAVPVPSPTGFRFPFPSNGFRR